MMNVKVRRLDILAVLGVNRIEDYKSKNPTVIKRDYKAKAEEAKRLTWLKSWASLW